MSYWRSPSFIERRNGESSGSGLVITVGLVITISHYGTAHVKALTQMHQLHVQAYLLFFSINIHV